MKKSNLKRNFEKFLQSHPINNFVKVEDGKDTIYSFAYYSHIYLARFDANDSFDRVKISCADMEKSDEYEKLVSWLRNCFESDFASSIFGNKTEEYHVDSSNEVRELIFIFYEK